MTDTEMGELSDKIATNLVDKLSDPTTISKIGKAWGNEFDVNIGKGIRKLVIYVIGLLVISASLKFNLFPDFIKRLIP